MSNKHLRAKRGAIEGWSEGATRRNTAFLRSIIEPELHGHGYAVTLTLRNCPDTSYEWHRMRRAWELRMIRAGMIRLHWVTEWQRRGVPHLHAAVWFENPYSHTLIVPAWVEIARLCGAAPLGQHVHTIDGPIGWFQYVSKHAARGVKHYQRHPENIPNAWQSRTGKVWGKLGHWPTREAVRVNLQGAEGDRGYFAFRRLVRSWRIGDARSKGDLSRLLYARRMLKSHDRVLSTVRGISEWIPSNLQDAFLANLQLRGFSVTC